MAKKTQAQVEFKANAQSYLDQVKSMNAANKTLSNELRLNSTELKGNSESIELLTQRQSLLQQQSQNSASKITALENALAEAEKTLGKNSKEYYNLNNSLITAKNQQASIQNEIKATTNRIDEQKSKVSGLDNEMEELSQTMQDTGEKTSLFGDILKAELSADVIKEGFSGLSELLFNNANDLEKATNSLITSTGALSEGANAYNGTTLELTETSKKFKESITSIYEDGFGESFDDISISLSEVKKQMKDLDETELTSVTKNALMLRDTFGYEVKESVRTAKSMMNAFGIDANTAFNLIVQGAQNGLDYSDELLDSIIEYSPQFEKLGLDAENMFQIFLSGADAGGFKLDLLGDAVKELSIRVIDGSDTTKEGFKLIGLNADEMSKKFSKGGETAKQAFYQTVEALKGMNDPLAQSTAGVDLFGTKWEDLGADVINSLGTANGNISTTKNSLEQINSIQYNDFKTQLETLKRGFEIDVTGVVNEHVLPALGSLLGFVNDNKDAIGALALGIGAGAATFGAATITIGIYNGVLDILKIKTIEGATATTLLGNAFTFFTSKTGIVTLAITGIVTAGVLLYQNWDTIKQKGLELWDGITNTFNGIKRTITDSFDGAKNSVRNAIDKMKSFFNFSWSLPKIKLPHFSIKGSFSIMPPQVPKFSISWYKRGGLFTRTTILPTNGMNANGFGEAGHEYALPLNKTTLSPLAEMISGLIGFDGFNAKINDALGNMTITVIVNNEIDGTPLYSTVSNQMALNIKKGR